MKATSTSFSYIISQNCKAGVIDATRPTDLYTNIYLSWANPGLYFVSF